MYEDADKAEQPKRDWSKTLDLDRTTITRQPSGAAGLSRGRITSPPARRSPPTRWSTTK